MIFKRLCVALALACPVWAAPILYSNGSLNGHVGFANITSSAVTNSVTFSSSVVLESVTFGAWVPTGEFLIGLNWAFSSSPFGAEFGGGGLTPTSVYQFTPPELGGNFDVVLASFALPPINLSPGTYFLTLSGADTNNGRFGGWDTNSGPSVAFSSTAGSVPSNFFEITGTVTPELDSTAAWSPLIFGGLLLGLRRRR